MSRPIGEEWRDDPPLAAASLASSMDAVVWAREFCKLNNASDFEMMVAWFANAIMAGYDEARRRALFGAAEKVEPAKVKCPNCRGEVSFARAHRLFDGSGGYACKPAQTEPAATEMSRGPLCTEHDFFCWEPAPPSEIAPVGELHHFRRPVKPECPNCLQEMDYNGQHRDSGDMPHVPAGYTCKPAHPESADFKQQIEGDWKELPAQLEPATPSEMPEAVLDAITVLRRIGAGTTFALGFEARVADALEFWCRSQHAPAAVRMTKELERVLEAAECHARKEEESDYPSTDAGLLADCQAVRAQAEQAQGKKEE